MDVDPSKFFATPTHDEDSYITVYDAISHLPEVSAGEGLEKTFYSKTSIFI